MRRIKARVIRNIGVEAKWLEKNPLLGDGEIALVRFGGRIRQKIGNGSLRFSELSYQDNDLRIPAIDTSFPFLSGEGPAPEGIYFAKESGTYQPGNVEVNTSGKMVMLVWDGVGELEKVETEMPDNSGKIAEWEAGTYDKNEVVTVGGKIYRATKQTTEEPPHEDWEMIGGSGATSVSRVYTQSDLPFRNGSISSGGVVNNGSDSRYVMIEEAVKVNGVSIELGADFRVVVYKYDNDYNFLERTSPLKNYEDLEFEGYLRLTVGYHSLTSITPETETGFILTNHRWQEGALQELERDIIPLTRLGMTTVKDIVFQRGSISNSTGLDVDTSSYIRSLGFIDVEGLYVSINEGFGFKYFLYDKEENLLKTNGYYQTTPLRLLDFVGKVRFVLGLPTGPGITLEDEHGLTVKTWTRTEVDAKKTSADISSPRVLYVAHRCCHFGKTVPENTIHSLRMAKRFGYAAVEIDVKKTLDDEYVIMHDNSLNRTMMMLDGSNIATTVNIAEKNLEHLRSNYVYDSDTLAYRTPIVTLREMLIECRNLEIYPVLDIKITDTSFLPLVGEIMGDDWCCFTSFRKTITEARKISPNCAILINGGGLSDIPYMKGLGGKVGMSSGAGSVFTPEFIQEFRGENLEMQSSNPSLWTGAQHIKRGVTILLTDIAVHPDILAAPVKKSSVDDGFENGFSTTGIIIDGKVSMSSGQHISTVLDIGSGRFRTINVMLSFSGELRITYNDGSSSNITAENDRDTAVFAIRKIVESTELEVKLESVGNSIINEITLGVLTN